MAIYRIKYKGKDINGNEIEGKARGFLARLLQHEIDHCHNKMCLHSYDPNSPQGAQADLICLRTEEVMKKKQQLGLKPHEFFPLMPLPVNDSKLDESELSLNIDISKDI